MSGKEGAVSSRDCVEILWGFTQSQPHQGLQDCREGEASAVRMKVNALASIRVLVEVARGQEGCCQVTDHNRSQETGASTRGRAV